MAKHRAQQQYPFVNANAGGMESQNGWNDGQQYGRRPSEGSDGGKKRGGPGLLVAAILLIVFGIALVVVALNLWLPHQRDYQAVHDVSAAAAQNVTVDAATGQPVVDFGALQAQYPEVVGWVQIPGTVVNYPVPQHSDNDFYLDHELSGEYNPYGSVFLDYRSDPGLSDYNTVIYGHHLRNGEEFAKIADYSDQEEFDGLSTVYYVAQDGVVHDLMPIACMVVNGYDYDSVRTDFTGLSDFQSYVQSTLDRASARVANLDVASVSHLYMLSTCSYERDNDRTVLACIDRSDVDSQASNASAGVASIQAAADEAAGVTDNGAQDAVAIENDAEAAGAEVTAA